MRLDLQISEYVATQHSCVAIWQLRDLGATSTEIARLRRSKSWRPISRRVLARSGSPETPEQLACGAVLEAGPTGALVAPSAAALWELGASYRLVPVTTMADHVVAAFTGELGRILPRRHIPDRWITTHRGIRVVRPELCIYQLCGLTNPPRAERALDTGLSTGLVTIASMRMCLDELRRRGRNGTSVLEGLLAVRPIGYVPVASGLEARFVQVVSGRWRRQVDSGGEMWAGRVDFRHEVQPMIVEVQSERHHGSLSSRRDDQERREKLESAGFIVAEVWDTQLWYAPDEARHIVQSALLAVQTTQNCVGGTAKSAG